jgi:hypothetical protein
MAAAATVTPLKKRAEEKQQAQQGFSLDDVLSSATKPKESKSSSKTPTLTVGPDVAQKIDRLRAVKEQIDSLTTEYDLLAAETIEAVEPLRVAAMKSGYTSSVKVPGASGMGVTISWSAKYAKVGLETAPAIQQVIGDRMRDYFANGLQITVTDVSEASLKELIQLVGPEQFSRFFAVERWLEPTRRYSEEFYTAFTDTERATLSGLVRQYKPSIKTR